MTYFLDEFWILEWLFFGWREYIYYKSWNNWNHFAHHTPHGGSTCQRKRFDGRCGDLMVLMFLKCLCWNANTFNTSDFLYPPYVSVCYFSLAHTLLFFAHAFSDNSCYYLFWKDNYWQHYFMEGKETHVLFMEGKETHVLFVEGKQIASLHDGRKRNKDV